MTLVMALISLTVLTMTLLAVELMFTYATLGFGYGFSANRAPVERSKLAKRIQNTYQNQVEANAYAVPVLAAAALVGVHSPQAQTAALIFVLGRVAFAGLYYTGIPFVRIPAFLVANLALAYIVYAVLTSGLL
ncbi:MAG: MAPEG family protein [Thalassovita sp.]